MARFMMTLPDGAETGGSAQFLDVDGDGYVSPSDALPVINYLNATNPARRSDPYFQELSESPSKPPEDNDSAEMLFLLASDQVLASNRRRGA